MSLRRPVDKRIRCPHCGVTTWDTDYTRFMSDHDRADGKRCNKAADTVQKPERWIPNWKPLDTP